MTSFTHNNINQLTSILGGGTLRFQGSVNETSKVTVANSPANVTFTTTGGTNTLFDGSAPVTPGTNVVDVIAEDFSDNIQTNQYQVVVSDQSARSLAYDLNGNLTSITSGSIITNYQWDAANRLTEIEAINGTTTNSTGFAYDGLSRRIGITEISGTTTNSDHTFIWCGTEICEERNSTGATVTQRFDS